MNRVFFFFYQDTTILWSKIKFWQYHKNNSYKYLSYYWSQEYLLWGLYRHSYTSCQLSLLCILYKWYSFSVRSTEYNVLHYYSPFILSVCWKWCTRKLNWKQLEIHRVTVDNQLYIIFLQIFYWSESYYKLVIISYSFPALLLYL